MGDGTGLSPLEALETHAKSLLGDRVEASAIAYGELTLTVHRETIIDSIRALLDDPGAGFISIIDI